MIPVDHFPLEMLPNHQRQISASLVKHTMHSSIIRMWITTFLILFCYCYYCSLPHLTSGKRERKVVIFPFYFCVTCKQRDWIGLAETMLEERQLQHSTFICFKLLGTISGKYQLPKSSVNFCFRQKLIIIFGACMLYTWPVQLNLFQTLFIEECMTTVLETRH